MLERPRAERARGCIIRFGIAPDKLYANHQVGDVAELTVQSLNAGVTCFFAIDNGLPARILSRVHAAAGRMRPPRIAG